jgi:hypothetical protein
MRTAMEEHFGGARDSVPAADYPLTIPSGVPGAVRLHIVRPSASGRSVLLPDATILPRGVSGGEPAWTVINLGTEAMDIEDSASSVVGTIDVDEAALIFLLDGSTAAGSWLVVIRTGAVESGSIPNDHIEIVLALQSGINRNIRTLCDQQGYDGVTPVRVSATLEVPSGATSAVIGSVSTSTPALATGTFPAGSSVLLTVGAGAYICGRGGNGAIGTTGTGSNGFPGGLALELSVDTTLVNYGKIQGGGGGGGSGDAVGVNAGPGGGGGAGYVQSIGGTSGGFFSGGNGGVDSPGYAGGTLTGGTLAGYGGVGGSPGGAGGAPSGTGGTGGAAGNAIEVVSGTLTQLVAGTINGAIV